MMNVSNAILVDTNVLIYAYDPRDRDKQEQAINVISSLVRSKREVVNVQCLSEFFNVASRRLSESMTRDEAVARVEILADIWRVLDLTPAVVLEGCRGRIQHDMSFWDSLIWAAAKLNQVPYLLTEDAEHGRFLEGMRFLNPFVPSFDLALLDSSV